MNPQNIIGEKLRQLRTKKGISQAELAKAIFVNNTTISNWEKGTRQIHVNSLKLICVYFGVTLDYFHDKNELQQIQQRSIPIKPIIAASASVALAVSVGVVLLGGPTGLINDACYGEENCYVIDDPSIVSELESRNLSGGLMTNIEMELVLTHLEQYLLNEDSEVNLGLVGLLNGLDFPNSNLYFVQRMLYHNDPAGIPNWIFDLRTINQNLHQYTLYEGDKFIVYKVGPERFMYEIYSDNAYTLTIDLSLNAFYWQDVKFVPPLVVFDNFLQQRYEEQTINLLDMNEFYFFEDLSVTEVNETFFVGSHTQGKFGFYHRTSHQYVIVYLIASYSVGGYTFEVSIQHREGVSPVHEYRFSLLNNFEGTYQSFVNFVADGNNIRLYDDGSENGRDLAFFNNDVVPLLVAMGDRPLTLFINQQ
ncbi:MAG: helix-turn-helix transcriptional regulator [Firmicutes bacterium]|nr:helix-turn-helix transcriptional regulator [Bacillota bacterium]